MTVGGAGDVSVLAQRFFFFLYFSASISGRSRKVTQLLAIKWRGRGRIADSAAIIFFRAAGRFAEDKVRTRPRATAQQDQPLHQNPAFEIG